MKEYGRTLPLSQNNDTMRMFLDSLKKLLSDVEKVKEVKGYDDDILIACWDSNTELRKDEVGEMLNPKAVVGNAPRHSGNYIEVPVVISDGEGA